MRYPYSLPLPSQRVRTPEETAALERRVPFRDPPPPSNFARYLPKRISLAQIAAIRSKLSVVRSPEATWAESEEAIQGIDLILKEIER